MCGIAGIVAADPAWIGPITAMTSALRHRGPDDEGYLVADSSSRQWWRYAGADTVPEISDPRLPSNPPQGANVALGHRRLSIIDLSAAGHGPMGSADGQTWVTYNGEIYNYVELREELRALGHDFQTGSDTEVLLAAYAQWGREALQRLNGMFAFGMLDLRRGELFCARDRFGVKPFYYFHNDSLFAFASEIKGLLAHPGVPCRPNERVALGFLVRGTLDEGEETFFQDIRALPASHALSLNLESSRLDVWRWYSLPETEPRPMAASAFRELLEDAIRLRLRSDVDVGTCLSGGLDSSSIVALSARLRAAAPQAGRQRVFSVLYDDSGMAEAEHVEAVVAHTGVEAFRTTAASGDLLRDLPALIRHQDEPLPSAGPYSHWRVMALAHENGIRVLLDGQGADELLAGYHYQFGAYLAETAKRSGWPAAIREAVVASRVTGHSLPFFLGMLAYHALPASQTLRDLVVSRAASHGYVDERLLDPGLLARVDPPRRARHSRRRTLREERSADLWATSLPALLRYEDRNSMAFGIEARTPFLDYRLVEAAIALPAGQLIERGWTKAILREAMRGILPESVRLRRDKLGFPTPERRWLRELAPQVREWLGAGSRVSPLLRAGALREWLAGSDEALSCQRGLWRLVCLEHWRRYVESARATAA